MILAGASLLALSIAVAVLIGPWAARWFLAAFWLLAASAFCYLGLQPRHRPSRGPVFAIALGFASLAAATVVRAVAGGRLPVVWILYAVATIGMVASFVLEQSARQESSSGQ